MTHGPRELQLYMEDDVYVEGGNLVLRTRERKAMYGTKEYNYTSGWVDSKHKVYQQFGRFEVRAKLPNPACLGIWPAHWLMPEPDTSKPPNVCWPVGGEIDIMEAVGGDSGDDVFGTFHWGEQCGKDDFDGHNGHYPSKLHRHIDFSADFHVFSVEWSTDAIQWFVDGHHYHTRTPATCTIPQDPFHFILNTAIDPNYHAAGVPFPVCHYIDSVRIYEWV